MASGFVTPTISGGDACLTVAAADTISELKQRADYVCSGTAAAGGDEITIQAALDACLHVILMPGTFWMKNKAAQTYSINLDSYQTLSGAGASSILKIRDNHNANLDVIVNTDQVAGNVEITVADLKIDGNRTNNAAGTQNLIQFTKVAPDITGRGCTISKVLAVESRIEGIDLDDCYNYLIEGCTCIDNEDGIWVRAGSYFGTIKGNHCFDTRGYGIINEGDNAIISSNICNTSLFDGINVTGNNNLIKANQCCQNGRYGIYASGSEKSIIGNYCEENSQTTDNAADNIYCNASYSVIQGNVCRQGALANQPRYGINIPSGTDILVIGNDLHDAGKTANLNDAGTCTTVRDNRETEITQVRDLVWVKNTSGGALAAGDVVILKSVAAGNEITTTAVRGSDKVFGMVAEAIADTAYGYVLVRGKATTLQASNDHGNIAIGDFLCCNDTVKECCLATAGDMAFAIALEACAVANLQIDALIVSSLKV